MVSQEWTQVSRSRAASLINQGEVRVGDVCKRPGYRVKSGETVTYDASTDLLVPELPEPERIPLSILHEDDHILVLDKPAGQVVHPAPGNMSGTLVNALMAYDPCFCDYSWEPLRPGIVHRLDKDTSGLIVVAKSRSSLKFLQKEFKQRRVEKHYLALVQGNETPKTGMIEKPIGRHPKKRKLMTILENGGKPAKTGFQVLEQFSHGALMDVRLYTGRTHQIRVHFYESGLPLLGERTYQVRRHRKGSSIASRQMLHSWTLSFRHPFSGIRVDFKAPMPEDFNQAIEKLKQL